MRSPQLALTSAFALILAAGAGFSSREPLLADEPSASPSRTPTIPNETRQALKPGPKIHVVRVPNPREPGPPGETITSPNPANNSQMGLGIQIPLWGGGKKDHPKKKVQPDDDDDDSDESANPGAK